MTRLEALEELLAAVKADNDQWSVHTAYVALNGHYEAWLYKAMNDSRDATADLHDAVLPEWFVARLMEDPEGKGWTCHLEPRNAPGSDWVDGEGDCAAKSHLAAILKALIAEERDK